MVMTQRNNAMNRLVFFICSKSLLIFCTKKNARLSAFGSGCLYVGFSPSENRGCIRRFLLAQDKAGSETHRAGSRCPVAAFVPAVCRFQWRLSACRRTLRRKFALTLPKNNCLLSVQRSMSCPSPRRMLVRLPIFALCCRGRSNRLVALVRVALAVPLVAAVAGDVMMWWDCCFAVVHLRLAVAMPNLRRR